MMDDPEKEDEPLTLLDRALWHLVSLFVGGIVGVSVAAYSERLWVGIVAGVAWVAIAIILARLGVWDWVERAVILIGKPFMYLFALIGGLITGVLYVLGGLIGLAIVLFMIVGMAGLLWFGIQQLF